MLRTVSRLVLVTGLSRSFVRSPRWFEEWLMVSDGLSAIEFNSCYQFDAWTWWVHQSSRKKDDE